MTDTADLRRRNLRQWIEKYYGGLQTRFAEAVCLNTGELSSLLKNKSFGEKKARKIEQAANMPAMWLDQAKPAAQTDHQERRTMSHISTIPEILADIKAGKMVIMMTQKNGAQYGTNFTVSIETAHGITTGISAADRALTIQTAVSPTAKPEDIVQPGHIFPLRAQKGGVLVRAGHTEAGVDLAQMNGLIPAAVICEIINDDGTMARMPELMKFAEEHNLKIGTIADLIEYRSRTESLLEDMGNSPVQTPWGEFQQHVYVDKLSGETHLALVKGTPSADAETLVRVHEPFSVMDFIQANPRHSWPKAQTKPTNGTAKATALARKSSPASMLKNCAYSGSPPPLPDLPVSGSKLPVSRRPKNNAPADAILSK